MSNQYANWNEQVIDTFRANGGEVPNFGRGLVLVHHTGAKTGAARISPVMSIRDDGDTWLIAASKAGAPENPAWYHNLLAHPDVEIETPDDGVVPVRASELLGAERDAAWSRFTTLSPGFQQYELKTSRTIPVLALRRRPTADH